MQDDTDPLVIRAELPTPDVVFVRRGLRTIVVADERLDDGDVANLIDDFDPRPGTGLALPLDVDPEGGSA